MSRNGVVGFNLLDDNFSRDASELDISEVGTAFVEKRFQQTIKKNTFKGVARGAMDMSMFRSVDGFYDIITVPPPPNGVTLTPLDNSVRVNWSAAGTNGGSPETGFKVYYGVTGTATNPTIFQDPIVISNPYTTSTTITGLTNGTQYSFKVRTLNDI
jgi:hypothetical protein